jgi:hypothetical protein
MHLTIAKINVNTTIQHMGLTPEGDMDVPKGADDVSWPHGQCSHSLTLWDMEKWRYISVS